MIESERKMGGRELEGSGLGGRSGRIKCMI